MTEKLLLRGFFALLYSGVFAWVVFERDTDSSTDSRRERYLPYISGMLLPVCMLCLLLSGFLFADAATAMQITLTFCFNVFLHICLYYLLLLPALPFLRRHISARACAMLWMLPNYLYLTELNYMELSAPSLVVEVPDRPLAVLTAVWAVGFAGVLGWKIASHLLFRARLLKGASPVTDRAVLTIWEEEIRTARFRKPKFRLMTSPDIRTPLSVGLFRSSIRVVLPERDYTPEELTLILRHEFVHIGREDSWNKFFLSFCLAMCWFNPLMWVAVRKSSEDLELGCDETVLLHAGEEDRRRYAGLLLKTAGDERGFTTCLSADASALRYRLRSVVSPGKKPSGALAVGLVFFLLCMSCGHVGLAYGERTGAEVIYGNGNPEEYTLRNAGDEELAGVDETALHSCLSALPMEHIAGNYAFEEEGRSLFLLFDTPEGALGVTLSDHFVNLVQLYGDRKVEYYYLPRGMDWQAIGVPDL